MLEMGLEEDIISLLNETDEEFEPKLSSVTDIRVYSKKISTSATIFAIYESGQMAAFIALYCNDHHSKKAFLTMIAVRKQARKKGFASTLTRAAIDHIKKQGFRTFGLEVYQTNKAAIALYESLGFKHIEKKGYSCFMELNLNTDIV